MSERSLYKLVRKKIRIIRLKYCLMYEYANKGVTDRWSEDSENGTNKMIDYECIRFFTSQTITKALKEVIYLRKTYRGM